MSNNAISSGALVLGLIDGEYKLALAREADKGHDAWVIPKGHVEPSEKLAEAALREVTEETGLTDISIIAKLGQIERSSIEKSGEKVWKVIHIYLAVCMNPPAELTPTDQTISEAGWLSIDDAVAAIPFQEDAAFVAKHLEPLVCRSR